MAALTIGLAAPTGASAGLVDDLVNGVNDTVNQVRDGLNGLTGQGGGGTTPPSTPAPTPAAGPGTPSSGTGPTPLVAGGPPELDGEDPHGQGVDLSAGLAGSDLATVGESTGSQDSSGDYHGEIVLASLLGTPLPIGHVETDEGETENTPTQGLNDALDDLCAAAGNNICLGVLDFSSSTSENGSTNHFSVLDAGLVGDTITTGVIQSNGNISESGQCQTAHGDSNIADLDVAAGAIGVDAMQSSSTSTACDDGTETTSATSNVANLNGGIVILNLLGCDGTTVNDDYGIAGVIDGTCNADDTDGPQGDAPYNVRDALTLNVLGLLEPLLGNGLAGLTGGSAQSKAEAPDNSGPVCPDPDNPDCDEPECPDASNPDCDEEPECPDASNPDCPDGPDGPNGPGKGPGPAGPSAHAADAADLPFTGADALTLALIGGGVMALGLALMALVDRKRRPHN